ncbi:MAG: Ribulose-phosphate 3-epimerase [Candidatus Yanofskybacteria bacterium GW2011_GWA2_44_9]|nr:MAG: Ribulose-phosphate 3-epimerase [Candidatus Yanofskybacteria bacterium GW2011_GWA2_44_9]
MIEVIPSILAQTEEEFRSLVRKLEPYVLRVHLDIADGILVPNKTIDGYKELMQIDTDLGFDVHLMVQKPNDNLDQWLNTKADRYFVHAESDHDLKGLIDRLKNKDKKVGIVLNPETGVEKVEDFLRTVDLVHFMTVHPGFYGGEFIDGVVGKISKFHLKYPNMPISVDGGINVENARKVKSAGATILISGNYVINSPDVKKAIEELINAQ